LLLNKVGPNKPSLKNLRKRESPRLRNSTFLRPRRKRLAERLLVTRLLKNSQQSSRSTASENDEMLLHK
jgi:hypothetical protein